MVENSGEYVLQWEGHAGHVTERFSGLFARQSLVDVTLICEEQRLRVHKLVLASCSLYFEEMLEQDLGQEPTILLSDLNFEVLKAMVEFMYCGETCVSEEHLEPLLHAARFFKVKELACIAENMMGPPQTVVTDKVKNCTDLSAEEPEDSEDTNDYSLFSDNDCPQSSRELSKIGIDELSGSELEEGFDINIESSTDSLPLRVPLSLTEIACRSMVKFYKKLPSVAEMYMEKMNVQKDGVNLFSEDSIKLEPVLYKQCCDLVNTEKVLNKTGQSRPEEKPALEFKELTITANKCLKVYTHKRRKSVEGVEKPFIKLIDGLPEPTISNNCIDLMEEPSKKETKLENNYILGFANENVESVVDFVNGKPSEEIVYSPDTLVSFNKQSRQMKEIFPNDNRIVSTEESDAKIYKSNPLSVPALRRSVRLNQQENEDSTNNNNNNAIQDFDAKGKDLRKESFRRKNKSTDLYCESDENEVSQKSITKCLGRGRSLRSNTTKLIERRRSKSRLSLSNGSDIEEQKPRDVNVESFPSKFNTIATVSRALWGDMSDCLENNENNIDFQDYSPSREIPFAVGLLPLRAALERMQATPDYQPRKTRSSVTPFRGELKGVKRKTLSGNNSELEQNNCKLKRQSSHSQGNNFPRNTVCHVRITTSRSEAETPPRRRLINEQVDAAAAISPTNIVNRQ